MADRRPKAVRRGNTSGLIGLWNRKAETENSPNVTSESLEIREAANRRISVRDPPKLQNLEEFHQHLRRAPTSTVASTSNCPRSRKTSEITRPTFKIREESEGKGLFASGVLREKKPDLVTLREDQPEQHHGVTERGPRIEFSFLGGGEPVAQLPMEEEDPDMEPEIENKFLTRSIFRQGRRGSKTTDDLEKFAKAYEENESSDKSDEEQESSNRRGVMRRSKSVKLQRVKFGLIPSDAEEGTNKMKTRQSPFNKFRQMESELNKLPTNSSSPSSSSMTSRLSRQASMPSSVMTSHLQQMREAPNGNKTLATGLNQGPPKLGVVVRSATSAKETILAWVQQQVNHYDNVNVTNFSMSWNDGLAFCALIHNFYPDAFDFSKLDARNRRYNFTLAFKTAEDYGGVCPLLDVDDMVKMKKPDWKCVFTYVQSFYRRFRNGRDPPTPTKTLVLTKPNSDNVRDEHFDTELPPPGAIRVAKHEYVFKADKVVEPFSKFKNFEIKPLPKTDFSSRKENSSHSSAMSTKVNQFSLQSKFHGNQNTYYNNQCQPQRVVGVSSNHRPTDHANTPHFLSFNYSQNGNNFKTNHTLMAQGTSLYKTSCGSPFPSRDNNNNNMITQSNSVMTSKYASSFSAMTITGHDSHSSTNLSNYKYPQPPFVSAVNQERVNKILGPSFSFDSNDSYSSSNETNETASTDFEYKRNTHPSVSSTSQVSEDSVTSLTPVTKHSTPTPILESFGPNSNPQHTTTPIMESQDHVEPVDSSPKEENQEPKQDNLPSEAICDSSYNKDKTPVSILEVIQKDKVPTPFGSNNAINKTGLSSNLSASLQKLYEELDEPLPAVTSSSNKDKTSSAPLSQKPPIKPLIKAKSFDEKLPPQNKKGLVSPHHSKDISKSNSFRNLQRSRSAHQLASPSDPEAIMVQISATSRVMISIGTQTELCPSVVVCPMSRDSTPVSSIMKSLHDSCSSHRETWSFSNSRSPTPTESPYNADSCPYHDYKRHKSLPPMPKTRPPPLIF